MPLPRHSACCCPCCRPQLLPNKGREAAVFLHHILAHYDASPEALYLVHDHGPASRHSLCGPFYRRVRGYYRGLAAKLVPTAAGTVDKVLATHPPNCLTTHLPTPT